MKKKLNQSSKKISNSTVESALIIAGVAFVILLAIGIFGGGFAGWFANASK